MKNPIVGGKSIARNAARNLLGQGLPLIVAAYCIPQLIAVLGVERFGFLTLIWVVVGYLSIFDLGLGQALTKLVAEQIGRGEHEKIPPLFWTAMWLMCGLGIVGMFAAEIAIHHVGIGIFNLSPQFQQEATDALAVAVLSLPFVIVSAGSRGVLEAHQRFDLVNWVRIPLGIFTFAAPLVVARYLSNELAAVAFALVFGRFVFLCGTMLLCFKIIPALRQVNKIESELLKPLFGFGGWMTVANLIGPMMVYLDRFVIGALLSMTAVAYYVTPYEVITKLWILPGALIGVLFSAFAINLAQHVEHTVKLFHNAMDGIFLLMLPIAMLAIAFAREVLTLWLGQDLAVHTTTVFQILAIGVFVNSLGRIPFVFIQAAGRPDIPAKLYLLELPLYLLSLWFMLGKWGVVGAAISWVARIVLDNVVLLYSCVRIVPALMKVAWRGIILSALACVLMVVLMVIEVFAGGEGVKLTVIVVDLAIFIAMAYWFKRRWHGESLAAKS